MVQSRKEIYVQQFHVHNAEREENYFGDSSSVCSEEASNCPEEQEFESFKTSFERRRRNVSKNYQGARKSKLSKKRGEAKVDKKMRILQQLIPNSNYVDNDCVLDEAIVYIKNLQNQLQLILSANAVIAGMYSWRMQANMRHELYAWSSIVQNHTFSCSPYLSGISNQTMLPSASASASEVFIQRSPLSLMSNSNLSTFSPFGSLMMPFRST